VGQHPESTKRLEVLYRERYRHFLRVACLITGEEERAHDAVQEGFAALLRSRDAYRGEGPLEAWVWRAIVNEAKKQRRNSWALAFPDQSLPSTENGDRERERILRTWIASLPERQRMAVYLRYYADLDYRAIAAVLAVEVGTVSATLSAAHNRLREQLQEVSQ
jgi:RNA polymerase sigma-70 factor (ECF subfamily)